MKKIISMTDFVINAKRYDKIENYANFLKQPLAVWQFVPCDENGNILEEPVHYETWLKLHEFEGSTIGFDEYSKYQQAKERCLFEGFSEKDARFSLFANETIEDLIEYNLQLTKTAEKLIGL